ncbi:MAG: CHASE domain-containing protein [Aquabacterium sp.]|uniref:CHASE domain-containing protein n=1 Tax=Aquabacterium sp. TaxID=1872578 RepID=UPI003BBE0C62
MSKIHVGVLRLLVESLAIFLIAEAVVMLSLPVLAPGLHGWQEALLDSAMLAVLSGPLLTWRAFRFWQRQAAADNKPSMERLLWSVPFQRSLPFPLLVLIVGAALSVMVAVSLHQKSAEAADAQFDRVSAQLQRTLEARLDKTLAGLKGVRGAMLAHGGELPQAGFRTWVGSRDVVSEFPGIRGMGFIKYVKREDLAHFIQQVRADHAPDYTVHPTTASSDLYVIKNIEPLEFNRPAWGFDLGSDPRRRQALDEVVATGQPSLTPPIVLLQDQHHRPGFLYLLPVFQPGVVTDTPQTRRAHLLGIIYAPIVAAELVAGLDSAAASLVRFSLYDGYEPEPAHWMAGTDSTQERQVSGGGQFRRQHHLLFGGRALTLEVRSTESFERDVAFAMPTWIGLLGLLLSSMIAAALWLLRTARVRAEDLAQAMTHESNALLQTLDRFGMVCVTAPDGRIMDVNEAFCHACGYERNELLGQNPRILNGGSHDDLFWITAWQALLHGRTWTGDICNRRRSGEQYWVHCVISPVLDQRGQVEKYISISYDITESRQAQDAIKANAERYNLAIDGGNDGLWDWMNIHSQEMWWSPQFFRLLGYSPGALKPDLATFDSMLHPEDQERTFATINAALTHAEPYDMEYRLCTRAGEYRWFRSRAKVYFDDLGRATRMAGSIQDVHERRLAQSQLQAHIEQMAAIFSLTQDAFVSFDAQGRVSYVSPATPRLTGMLPGALHGLDEATFIRTILRTAVDEPEVFPTTLETLLHEAGHAGTGRVMLEMKPPARRMLELRLSQGQGVAVSQVLHLRDVTHETEVDEMKSAFLSVAAHELRTPMASIYGFTELLLTRELKPEKQRELLGRIYRQSEAMAAIINELLDLSRLEARQGKDFEFTACNLESLVQEVIRDFKAPEGRGLPNTCWPDEPVMVWVDQQKMRQAVLNVLSNAYKYSPAGGDVWVYLLQREENGRQVVGVQIRDFGLGMNAEQLSRVGERFYRADKSGNIPGTGLGVAIVKEIMELMGGRVVIDSKEGEGTTVTLVLNCQSEPQVLSQA